MTLPLTIVAPPATGSSWPLTATAVPVLDGVQLVGGALAALSLVAMLAPPLRPGVFTVFGLALFVLALATGLRLITEAGGALDPAGLAWLAAAVAVVTSTFSRPVRRVMLRAALMAVLFGLIGTAAYQAVGLAEITDETLQQRLLQAQIAGAVIAAGWIVTFSIQELRAEQTRKQREEEMMIALAAETLDLLRDPLPTWANVDAMVTRILESDTGTDKTADVFHPFLTGPKPLLVFDALISDFHQLPTNALTRLTTFYTQVADVAALTEEMRSDRYRSLEPMRRAKLYVHRFELTLSVFKFGLDAFEAMNRALPLNRRIADGGLVAKLRKALADSEAKKPADLDKWLEGKRKKPAAPAGEAQ